MKMSPSPVLPTLSSSSTYVVSKNAFRGEEEEEEEDEEEEEEEEEEEGGGEGEGGGGEGEGEGGEEGGRRLEVAEAGGETDG